MSRAGTFSFNLQRCSCMSVRFACCRCFRFLWTVAFKYLEGDGIGLSRTGTCANSQMPTISNLSGRQKFNEERNFIQRTNSQGCRGSVIRRLRDAHPRTAPSLYLGRCPATPLMIVSFRTIFPLPCFLQLWAQGQGRHRANVGKAFRSRFTDDLLASM